jgi:hypothetical protein
MKKILIVIPHYCSVGNTLYGSTGGNSALRKAILERVITGLHQTAGSRQAFLLWLQAHVPGKGNGHLIRANDSLLCELDLVLCTTGDSHLVPSLTIPPFLFRHHHTGAEPMKIGFAAQRFLRDHLSQYDWFCYLEDDLLITDPYFFQKLEWFVSQYGEETTLSPHRFEISATQPVHKLYHDGSVRPDFTAAWQDVDDRRHLEGEHLGMSLRFERWPNPHSGCFFLNRSQMARWVAEPHFGDEDSSFAGPLESAASLGIIKTFRQYKPSPANAAFFELQHLHPRYLGEALKFQ